MTSDKLPIITDPTEAAEWLIDNEPSRGWSVGQMDTAMTRVGRNAAPALFVTLHHEGALTRDHYIALVTEVWMMCEFPTHQLDPDEWRVLFSWAGYTRHQRNDTHGRRWPRRRKPVTLYRGAHADRRMGWSWASNRESAQWFADRDLGRGPGRVWTVTVPPHLLLAQIDARGEHEYVVDPDTLAESDVTEDAGGEAQQRERQSRSR